MSMVYMLPGHVFSLTLLGIGLGDVLTSGGQRSVTFGMILRRNAEDKCPGTRSGRDVVRSVRTSKGWRDGDGLVSR